MSRHGNIFDQDTLGDMLRVVAWCFYHDCNSRLLKPFYETGHKTPEIAMCSENLWLYQIYRAIHNFQYSHYKTRDGHQEVYTNFSIDYDRRELRFFNISIYVY